ncbi:MAG: electron transport complex subunit RsxC [Candidatus Omnitrophica bacterium]|nr:electron transport complex subunit RsxC [Candidatus Omnitrophota bacterium]MBU1869270.1 electron transport complex subunit RsxC [Candidatus Omnitrophota bacterium]
MVRLEEHKQQTEHKAIENLPMPQRVYITLSQHLGKVCEPLVKVGDPVFLGQKIAAAQAHVFSLVYSSVSGKVGAIQEWPHPVLGRCKAIVIENDGLDKLQVQKVARSQEEVGRLTPEVIRNIVFEAGIVGMGGASFPSHIKLNPPKPVDILVINGAECEPYLTSDSRLMIEKAKEILLGSELVAKCVGAKDVYIGIEDNKPEAIEIITHQVTKSPSDFARGGQSYKLKVLKSAYPQGGEKQLIKNVLGKEVPSGKLPFDIGVVVQNVATCFAIYEAVYLGKPLYERVVTVTGDCLESPKNLLARIGTPIKELIDFCGPRSKEPSKIIMGGPMMGFAQFTDQVPVIKSTNGVLVLSDTGYKTIEDALCIRCSRCVQECPVGLMPCLIAMASQKERWDLANDHRCMDCMECGVCSYTCPQKINLVQLIKQAKMKVAR